MRPRTDEILKSLLWTFDEYIVPEVTSPYAKSLTLTMGNLLRHVTLRAEQEGDLLFADNNDLRGVLQEVVQFIENGTGDAFEAMAKAGQDVADTTGQRFYGGDVYPSVIRLVDEATALRGALSRAIVALQGQRPALGDDPNYKATRQAIRDYLGRQLDREAQLIEPAFTADRR